MSNLRLGHARTEWTSIGSSARFVVILCFIWFSDSILLNDDGGRKIPDDIQHTHCSDTVSIAHVLYHRMRSWFIDFSTSGNERISNSLSLFCFCNCGVWEGRKLNSKNEWILHKKRKIAIKNRNDQTMCLDRDERILICDFCFVVDLSDPRGLYAQIILSFPFVQLG